MPILEITYPRREVLQKHINIVKDYIDVRGLHNPPPYSFGEWNKANNSILFLEAYFKID